MDKGQKAPSVSIVVANYNGEPYLGNCLGSLLAMDYPQERLSITVVDNVSSDGSIGFIQSNFPTVKVIRNTVNNYARANNLGIMDSKCDYVGFVNNDVYLDKMWLAELIKVINSNGAVCCAGGKVLFTDGRIQSAGHQEFPGHYWGDKGLGETDLGQYDRLEEVLSLSGSAVLFRRKCLEDVGYFDEDFEMYLEDVDIFLRCRKKGWKMCYVPGAIAHHKFHGSITPERVGKYIRRNRLLLVAKHFPDKLAGAVAGKEIFSAGESVRVVSELCDILPLALSKMINCHGEKTAVRLMPEILRNMQLVFNYERDRAIQYLNAEKERLNGIIEGRDRQINTLGSEIQAERQMWEEQRQIWATHEKEFEKAVHAVRLELERAKGIGDERQVWIEALESNIRILRGEKEGLGQELAVRKAESEMTIQSLNSELEKINRISNERQERIRALESSLRAMSEEREKERQGWIVRDAEFEKKIQSTRLELERIKEISEKKQKRTETLESDVRLLEGERRRVEDNLRIREEDILCLKSELIARKREIEEFKSAIQEIVESNTYRFINKPLWRILDFLKAVHLFPSGNPKKGRERFLVIKPQEVTLAQTENAVRSLRAAFPGADISLLANVSEREYEELNRIPFIDEKIYYSPGGKKLTRLEILKLFFVLPQKKYKTAFVLAGVIPPGYGGYRRAQILAWLSGSRSRVIYDVLSPAPTNMLVFRNFKIVGATFMPPVLSGRMNPTPTVSERSESNLKQKDKKSGALKEIKGFSLLLQHCIHWLSSQILFYGFLLFFIIFITGGIKVRRILFKLRRWDR